MSTATTFPEPETSAQASQEPHPEATSWQETVLGLLAQGASVVDAMRQVGYSSAAFYKACKRHPEFRIAAGRARNDYRTQVAEEFHDAEAYARSLVDSVMRDEQLPASLRLRAALAILNRKGDHWLPMSIPAPEDTVDTVDTMDTAATVDNMDTTDNTDTLDTEDSVDTMDTTDNLEDLAYRHILSEIEAMDSAFHSALQNIHPAVPETEMPVDTVDTPDTANGHPSNAPQSRTPITGVPQVPGTVAA